jgi:signal transduction histidine kinase
MKIRWRWWPRTLAARLMLILFGGLVLAHCLSYGLIIHERSRATTSMMLGYMELDVASSVALLDRLPAAERAQWLPRLARHTYRFLLGPGMSGPAPDAQISEMLASSLEQAIGKRYPLTATAIPGGREHLQVHLRLTDGMPLTIDLHPQGMPVSPWLVPVLIGQLALLAVFSGLCVRLATRPLAKLANAADKLGPDFGPQRLDEGGPVELVRAASAFNSMQDRIATYMTERVQILASISHDLQTPITRMRLRTDLMDDDETRTAIQRNLCEMEELVREGVTYARTLHGTSEQAQRLDPDALLASLVGDYADASAAVTLDGRVGHPITTRPVALRRILVNFIDNALKFGGSAHIVVRAAPTGAICISVLDEGPGIPPEKLETVFQPFYRIEGSRNRSTGGTGLGLAIARQLALAIGAKLKLANREGGGLEACISLNATEPLSV